MSLLAVEDLVVRFGGVTAVDHASFEVGPGTLTGLIGPNGAGKTTCFDVITGLQRPTSGRIRFRGRDITRSPAHKRAHLGFGRTFQRLEAFGSLSVRDNVRVALDIGDGVRGLFRPPVDDVDHLLARVGIADYADRRADSVPTGVARLLDLARALASRTSVLLLDEPSSGLDERETAGLGALLRELVAEGRTVLMVEHDMDLVMSVCDGITVLDHGVVIAAGTPAEVRADPLVQQAYLGHCDEGAGTETTSEIEPVTETIPTVRP